MAGLVDERGGAAVHLGLQARVSRLSGSWSPWAARHAPLLTGYCTASSETRHGAINSVGGNVQINVQKTFSSHTEHEANLLQCSFIVCHA